MTRRIFIAFLSVAAIGALMFRSLFRKTPASDTQAFRDRVLKIAKASHPNVSLEAPENKPEVIIANRVVIGLQNLRSKFEQTDHSEKALAELVETHLSLALQSGKRLPEFDAARTQLKPQLMPPEYASQAPIISFPFGRTLAVGIVLDEEKGYRYLKKEDALSWKKSEKELLDVALANLDDSSHGIAMQASDTEAAKWVGIATMDGFDAARILAPKLREFIAGRVGSPFSFAVPNRDFLICWNTGASARFEEFTTQKIQKDFQTQPYPLSQNLFEMAADGTVTERS